MTIFKRDPIPPRHCPECDSAMILLDSVHHLFVSEKKTTINEPEKVTTTNYYRCKCGYTKEEIEWRKETDASPTLP